MPNMRVAQRHETADAIVYTFAEVGDPGLSKFTIYKTTPVSYKHEPSAFDAERLVAASWEALATQYDGIQGITWENI